MMTEEQRLTELEIKFAYQEDLLQELNAVVARQQQEISQLEKTCQILAQRLKTLIAVSEIQE